MTALGKLVIGTLWVFACALAAALAMALTSCGHASPIDAQHGAQMLDYAQHLEACDTAKDAGADARAAVFEACVQKEGLSR